MSPTSSVTLSPIHTTPQSVSPVKVSDKPVSPDIRHVLRRTCSTEILDNMYPGFTAFAPITVPPTTTTTPGHVMVIAPSSPAVKELMTQAEVIEATAKIVTPVLPVHTLASWDSFGFARRDSVGLANHVTMYETNHNHPAINKRDSFDPHVHVLHPPALIKYASTGSGPNNITNTMDDLQLVKRNSMSRYSSGSTLEHSLYEHQQQLLQQQMLLMQQQQQHQQQRHL